MNRSEDIVKPSPPAYSNASMYLFHVKLASAKESNFDPRLSERVVLTITHFPSFFFSSFFLTFGQQTTPPAGCNWQVMMSSHLSQVVMCTQAIGLHL